MWIASQAAVAAAANPENTLYLDLEYGRVVIRMRPDLAPQHVARIKQLVRGGFYDGIVFHRVIEGAIAQGGDPTGRGDGGSGRTIKSEFTRTPQIRGVVSMARGAGRDSADSQFFIVLGDIRGVLEGQYTVWGEVTSGMEFVDMIRAGDKNLQGKVANPDRILKLQVASDAERGFAKDDPLKRADIGAAAADFSAADVRCTALADRSGSETQAALAQVWGHGLIAGYARAAGHLHFADGAESGLDESCAARADVFLRTAALHAAETLHDLPPSNGVFDASNYTCQDFTSARKNKIQNEAELAGLWSFAFIQGYKNVGQPALEMPFESGRQLMNVVAKTCEANSGATLLDITAAVAAKVKLQ